MPFSTSAPIDSSLHSDALRLLRQGTGNAGAEFRPGQWEAILELVEGSGRLLLIQRAGWGKSMVYFIAAKLLRLRGGGPALLVSPLLALMRNQEAAASRIGVVARTINSSNEEEWDGIEGEIEQGELDLLLISPERFANDQFINNVFPKMAGTVPLLVVDEAHCISDWGHDFRPHYRRIGDVINQLPPGLRVLATTATANRRVTADISEVFGSGAKVIRGNLALPNVSLQTIRLPSPSERLAWLAEQIPQIDGAGIVYALTVLDVNRVADFLQSVGIDAHAYHAQMEEETRRDLELCLLNNDIKVLIATVALGMGFDKSDLRFVFHYQSPSSPVAYYQQVGRAGRDGRGAFGVLLSGPEEDDINDFFTNSGFPEEAEVEGVIAALDAAQSELSVAEIERRVDIRRSRIDKVLQLMSLEFPPVISRAGSKWSKTESELTGSFWERVDRVTRQRRDEQAAMARYVELEAGHMSFLMDQLNSAIDPTTHSQPGKLRIETRRDLVNRASMYLNRQWMTIDPRKRMPSGLNESVPDLSLGGNNVNNVGRALSIYGDVGWGAMVKRNKYEDCHFDDELIGACLEMIDDWCPNPAPEWVTSVPSRTGNRSLDSFVQRLADALGLEYINVLETTGEAAQQKNMQNSIHQARNAVLSMRLATPDIPGSAVLLVDDTVDSGWTLTIAGMLLREHGSGPVFPLALAQTRSGADR